MANRSHEQGKQARTAPTPDHWRSVDERLRVAEWMERARPEFPEGADFAPGGLSRRGFLKLLGASAALAGAAACEQPLERILPYTDQPPEVTPGVPRFYATSMNVGGYATGLLVESHSGRPVKVEGHPEHPASLGAAGVYEQASPLGLYDPERAREIRYRRGAASWDAVLRSFSPAELGSGEGLRLLLEPTSSPLLIGLLERVQQRYPAARVFYHAPLSADSALGGARRVFGRALQTHYNFARARVILALDADFLASGPFHLRHARAWAEQRRLPRPDSEMNRLYVAEGMLTATGAAADHRLRVRPSEMHALAAALLAELVLEHGLDFPGATGAAARELLQHARAAPADAAWIRAVARDLAAHRGNAIVIAGERQTPEVHALAHLLNATLSNLGTTVSLSEPVLTGTEPDSGLEALAAEVRAGEVETLLVLGSNPAYTAPADLDFGRLLETVPRSLCLDLYETETAQRCDWFVPALHYLESWGDSRAFDGTVTFVQPLIRPLYPDCRGESQLLAALLGETATPHALLTQFWREQAPADFEAWWEQALHTGFLPGTEAQPVAAAPRWEMLGTWLPPAPAEEETDLLEAVFVQSPSVYDGRFANNAWLLEFPDPMTKLAWDNAAVVSPRTAAALAVEPGDVVELTHGDQSVRAPVFVLPGVADGLAVLPLGYGHEWGERLGNGVGFNAYVLRTTGAPYIARGVRAARVEGNHHPLPTTQDHWSMEGRPIVLHATLAEYRENPLFAAPLRGPTPSLYEPFEYEGLQWSMSIDLNVCTGCSACVIACQAENNVPVVGREGVLNSREMHWLRIDRYFTGDEDDPAVLMQPMLCQHCEKAPCEYVCPVNATVHSPDGLNEMVYNRCVGTRFCSNNCPYKVRRFNWFDYNREKRGTTLAMLMNPDVTVRERGVMEKCTFCVQRIRRAEIDAKIAGEDIQHRELQTACQQACPTRAIQFGSLNDPDSAVVRERRDPRSYAVLHDLGTEPRVRYLARISNPNPALSQRAASVATALPGSAG